MTLVVNEFYYFDKMVLFIPNKVETKKNSFDIFQFDQFFLLLLLEIHPKKESKKKFQIPKNSDNNGSYQHQSSIKSLV